MTTAYVEPHPQSYSADELRICEQIHELKVKRTRAADATERMAIQNEIYRLSQQLVTLQRQERERQRAPIATS